MLDTGRLCAITGHPRTGTLAELNAELNRDTDILPDNTYSYINNGCRTCSWLNHIEMSNYLSKSTVDCHTLHDAACSDHCAITVTLNFDQLPMTHTIVRQNKHINWKYLCWIKMSILSEVR